MSLQKIQAALKAPKSQFNAFGKFHYRNLEDILNAVKPLLAEYEYSLVIEDAIVMIGDRFYIKASAFILGPDNKLIMSSTAYAREAMTKKGMDEAQITGATSSYARKYALNGLFAIDDTKDADSQDNSGIGPISRDQLSTLNKLITDVNGNHGAILAKFKIERLADLPNSKYQEVVAMCEEKRKQAAQQKDKGAQNA